MKKHIESKEELKTLLKYCTDFETTVVKQTNLKLVNYTSFKDFFLYLGMPNDAIDAENIFKDVSPYQSENTKITDDIFPFETDKDDHFLEYIGPDVIKKRQKTCWKPSDFSKEMADQDIRDPISQEPMKKVIDFMEKIESWFVIQHEKLDIILELASQQWDTFDKMVDLLKVIGFIKDDNSSNVYKALANIVSLPLSVREWKNETIKRIRATGNLKVLLFDSSALNSIFTFLGRQINEDLMESIIHLAHGVITSSNLKELSVKFSLDTNLIQSFFLASRPYELK